MARYAHLHLCFACDEYDGVAALASKHLQVAGDAAALGDSREAYWFLQDLSRRTGTVVGVKGGLCLWGMVGNHTDAALFARVLQPFWRELLSGEIEGGPQPFEHVVIFFEPEGAGTATAIEVYLDGPWDERAENRDLRIVEHPRLPFSWNEV